MRKEAELRGQWKLHPLRSYAGVQGVIFCCGLNSKLLRQYGMEKISCLYGRQK